MQQDKSSRTRSNLERPQPRHRVIDKAGLRGRRSFRKWRCGPFTCLLRCALASAKQKQARQHQDGYPTHYDIQPGNAAACFNHAFICASSSSSPS
jgi:hypothetical protein